MNNDSDHDVTMGTTIGACGATVEFPRYQISLAQAKPFLMPSFDDKVVEILPSEKANRMIRWEENILVQEIENRFAYAYPDEEDDDSYEIEIVEDDGDADFYLEIVDGEVFYVFETEDDISEEDSDEEMEEDSETTADLDGSIRQPLQLPIGMMAAPNLDGDDNDMQPVYGVNVKQGDLGASFGSFVSGCDSFVSSVEGEEESLIELTSDRDEFELQDEETDEDTDPLPPQTDRPFADSSLPTERVVSPNAPTVSPALSQPEPSLSPPSAEVAVTVTKTQDDEEINTPPTHRKQSVAIVDQIPEPVSPIARNIVPASPASGIRSPTKSILKACPESPKKPPTPKKKKKKGEKKKEKTFTKTYVRPEEFDGEHRVYSWEKPDWTKTKLRSTGKGEDIRKGGNLANPITFPKKKPVNENIENEENYETVNKEELIRRIKGGDTAIQLIPLPGYRGRQRKLKFSMHGARIRDGGDIVKPITKATSTRKKDDINYVANPVNLRTTATGSKVREGKNLAAPVTMATARKGEEDIINHVANKNVLKNKGVQPAEKKAYEWEKPSWAKPKLQSAEQSGDDAAESTTTIGPVEKKKYEWEKPDWTKRKLGSTSKGEAVKKGETLSNPITFPVGQGDGINTEVQPDAVLNRSNKGEEVRQGENLARPITKLPDLAKQRVSGQ